MVTKLIEEAINDAWKEQYAKKVALVANDVAKKIILEESLLVITGNLKQNNKELVEASNKREKISFFLQCSHSSKFNYIK